MISYKKAFCVVSIGFLLTSTNLLASEKTASEVMKRAFQYTANMDKYAFSAMIIENVAQEDGTTAEYRYDTVVKVERPNKLRVDTKSEYFNRTNYINNGLYTIIEQGHGYYGQLNVPKDLDKALDSVFRNYDIKAPLASLVYSDMEKRIKVNNGKYFGTVDVGGVECDYIAFKNNKREVHVWVTTAEPAQVKTYSIIDKSEKPFSRTDAVINWNNVSTISENDFIFKAPKGATKISIEPAN